jgi:ribosomal protein L11
MYFAVNTVPVQVSIYEDSKFNVEISLHSLLPETVS